ncbi:hypothetical protein [Noviherbaspirillum aerium]|uniref:hypothetical protein n=1 Tax=Noviherbaspirillum aerium TaxID=2588497 RepID=UPI00124F2139|nr:hypothetical protein [Noviherbaspirillum aerium]
MAILLWHSYGFVAGRAIHGCCHDRLRGILRVRQQKTEAALYTRPYWRRKERTVLPVMLSAAVQAADKPESVRNIPASGN